MEDLIRDPDIDAIEAVRLKRWIDKMNQERTDMVEYVDKWFLKQYANVTVKDGAKINTESPAWAVDRLSILALKIYHMQEEVDRTDASAEHRMTCQAKLDVLIQQQVDLSTAIEQLFEDFRAGNKYIKVYKQMRMYKDASLNPVLYASKLK